MDRIIALVDMDCFYCQVETCINPSLKGKPVGVAQHTEFKGHPLGRLIAINYEAKAKGVTRSMLADEAKKVCPELEIVGISQVRGKADLTKYRDASRRVFDVLLEFNNYIEKASVDEAYLDLTETISNLVIEGASKITEDQLPNTYVIGYCNDSDDTKSTGVKEFLNEVYYSELNDTNLIHLATAAVFVQQIRSSIYEKTGFHCSAGIAHNKMLAKIACGLHKPNCQTILPVSGVPVLYRTLPVKKVRNLGGQFGDIVMETLGCSVMADIEQYSLKELQRRFPDKTAQWLYDISRGIDLQPVKSRMIANSISCCKKFPGQSALCTKQNVDRWLIDLATELNSRLQVDIVENKRRGTLLILRYQHHKSSTTGFSKSVPLYHYETDKIVEVAQKLLAGVNKVTNDSESWSPPLIFLGLGVSKFISICDSGSSIRSFMKPITESSEQNVQKSSIPYTSGQIDTPSSSSKVYVTKISESELPHSVDLPFDISKSFFYQYFLNKNKTNIEKVVEDEIDVNKTAEVETNLIDPLENIIKNECDESVSDDCDNAVGNDIEFDVCSRKNCVSNNLLPDNCNNKIKTANRNDIIEGNIIDNSNQIKLHNAEVEIYETCSYCNERILLVEFCEHMDYHVAKELHKELNSNANVAPLPVNANLRPKETKRKRNCNKKQTPNSTVKKSESILSFFSSKQ